MDIIDINPSKKPDNMPLNNIAYFADDLQEHDEILSRQFQKRLDEKEKLAKSLFFDLTHIGSSDNSLGRNNNRLILKDFNDTKKRLSLKSGVQNKLIFWLGMEEEFIVLLQHFLSTGKLSDHQRLEAQHQLAESLAFYNQLKMIKESIHYLAKK
jgi:hypothetical protein